MKNNITHQYFKFLDTHLDSVISGESSEMIELNQIASELCVSHKYLIEVVKNETGKHPCYFYEYKILEKAQKLLVESELSIAKIAGILTYDPSNFGKFFKKYAGVSPGKWRVLHKALKTR